MAITIMPSFGVDDPVNMPIKDSHITIWLA